MRLFDLACLMTLGALLAGCATSEPKFADVPLENSTARKPVTVKRDETLTGRVVSANARGRFAILNFPVSRMPAVDTKLSVYRDALKVGEVRISGPQKDDNIVADVTTGEARTGDEVREH